MTDIEVSIRIDRSLHDVWDQVSRLEDHADWMMDVESITFLDNQTSGIGTTMDVLTRVGPFTTTDVFCDRRGPLSCKHHFVCTPPHPVGWLVRAAGVTSLSCLRYEEGVRDACVSVALARANAGVIPPLPPLLTLCHTRVD